MVNCISLWHQIYLMLNVCRQLQLRTQYIYIYIYIYILQVGFGEIRIGSYNVVNSFEYYHLVHWNGYFYIVLPWMLSHGKSFGADISSGSLRWIWMGYLIWCIMLGAIILRVAMYVIFIVSCLVYYDKARSCVLSSIWRRVTLCGIVPNVLLSRDKSTMYEGVIILFFIKYLSFFITLVRVWSQL